jgi:hypothetical protein
MQRTRYAWTAAPGVAGQPGTTSHAPGIDNKAFPLQLPAEFKLYHPIKKAVAT